MTDVEMQRAVVEALDRNRLVHAEEISVEVSDGDVALRGTVGSILQEWEATSSASSVPGIRSLDNQLQVRLMGTEGHADADTEAAVLDALATAQLLEGAEVDVEVRDGTVTLRGGVELASRREEVARVAHGVPGVARVVNRLDVWLELSSEYVVDRLRDAILGLDRIAVRVDENDVTLTGTVSSREHHDVVLAAASSTPGVAAVHDDLTVRSTAA
jgi:osmotically-inducible protein OsmY